MRGVAGMATQNPILAREGRNCRGCLDDKVTQSRFLLRENNGGRRGVMHARESFSASHGSAWNLAQAQEYLYSPSTLEPSYMHPGDKTLCHLPDIVI